MPQITVDIKGIRTNQSNFKFEAISDSGLVIRRELALSDFATIDDFALWLLSQEPDENINSSFRKRLVIEFHVEEDIRVMDSVTANDLPEEKALGDIGAIPGWATWDVTMAQDWIETNVTSLATAKIALKALAQMVILERDAIKGLKRAIE